MRNTQESAVSPIVATVLLLGLTVSLAAIAAITLFDSFEATEDPKLKLNVVQEINESNPDTTDIIATVVKKGNTQTIQLVTVDTSTSDSNKVDTSIGKRVSLSALDGGTVVQIVAETEGSEQAIVDESVIRNKK